MCLPNAAQHITCPMQYLRIALIIASIRSASLIHHIGTMYRKKVRLLSSKLHYQLSKKHGQHNRKHAISHLQKALSIQQKLGVHTTLRINIYPPRQQPFTSKSVRQSDTLLQKSTHRAPTTRFANSSSPRQRLARRLSSHRKP